MMEKGNSRFLSNIACPISNHKIDSHVSRITVFLNAVLMVHYLLTQQPISLFIVTIDYGIRAFWSNRYSPLCFISNLIVKILGAEAKMVDHAPKVFASRLGFICALFGAFFFLYGMPAASQIIIGLFTVLAVLDSVFNLCVDCLIYHYFVFPFFEKRRV